jgi:two-component system, NarL family, invasion response regulator UvrY
MVRRGLVNILAEEPDIVVGGEAGDAQEALNFVREYACDVMILDISLRGRSGLEVLKEVRQRKPQLPVLILSMHPEDQFAIRALKAGAAGYITKESTPEELVKAIRKVKGGGKYVSSSLAEKIVVNLETDSKKNLQEKLSDREYQVMRLLASGKTASEIAEELNLSVKV